MIFDQALQARFEAPVKGRYFAPTDPPRALFTIVSIFRYCTHSREREPVVYCRRRNSKGVPMQQSFVNLLFCNNSGATSIEYALLASLVSMVILTGAGTVGASLTAVFTNLGGALGG